MRNEGAHPRSGDLVRQIEHALGRRVTSMRPLGAGVDHVTFEIDGDLVAKVTPDRRGDTARHVDREARLLELIGPRLPVAVPKVVAIDPPGGLLVLTKIQGTSLLDRPSPEPERLVPTLVAVLGALRSIPSTRTADVAELDDAAPQDWLDEAAATYTRIAVHLEPGSTDDVSR
jgi:aminoglycoside phosphotransferase (APT) family kinase protein